MKPIKEFRNGLVKAALFEKQVKGTNGTFTSRSIALQVGYKNKESEEIVNKQINLTAQEINKVQKVLDEVKQLLN